jgi:hypothetical protein
MPSKLEGKLWIDKSDFGWIKVGGQVAQSSSLELFVAPRAAGLAHHPGAVELGDAISVPQRLEVRKSARIFFLKSLAMERIFTYSDYRPETEGPHSVSK